MSPPIRGTKPPIETHQNKLSKIKTHKQLVKNRKLRSPNCHRVYPGDFIYIPDDPPCHLLVYEVRKGDTLARIAKRFGRAHQLICSMEENRHLRITGATDKVREWIKTLDQDLSR